MKLSDEWHEYHIQRDAVFCDLMKETRERSYHPLKELKPILFGEARALVV